MGKDTNTVPLASGALAETSIACLYSNENINKTAIMLRFGNRLIVILATPMILCLITEKLSVHTFVLPAP